MSSRADEGSFNLADFERLEERIERLISDGIVAARSHAIVHLILTNKFYCQPFEIHEAMTDGPNDSGIDAVYIDRRGDEPAVHLFQSKVFESERKARNPFPASSLEKVYRFFQILKNRKADLKKLVNPQLEQKVLEIRHEIDRHFPTFKVWLVSNGTSCLPHEMQPLRRALSSQEDVEIEEFHLW